MAPVHNLAQHIPSQVHLGEDLPAHLQDRSKCISSHLSLRLSLPHTPVIVLSHLILMVCMLVVLVVLVLVEELHIHHRCHLLPLPIRRGLPLFARLLKAELRLRRRPFPATARLTVAMHSILLLLAPHHLAPVRQVIHRPPHTHLPSFLDKLGPAGIHT